MLTGSPSLHTAGEWALNVYGLRGWPGDGIILAANEKEELGIARRMKIPVVNFACGTKTSLGVPRVMVDQERTRRLGAEHLVERGFKHLAYLGIDGLWFSKLRERGFVQRAADFGIEACSLAQPKLRNVRLNWRQCLYPMVKWLKTLPKPIGILAAQDYRARLLIAACEEAGLHVPLDVAIVGVDNDTTICAMHHPIITSISRNSREVGRTAAKLLHGLMNGCDLPPREKLVPADGVVSRESTEILVVRDVVVRAAVYDLKSGLNRPGSVKELADRLGGSRRSLEMRFQGALGLSPYAYWTRLRIERAQRMLVSGRHQRLSTVVAECGFSALKVFRAAFLRVTGVEPSQFR